MLKPLRLLLPLLAVLLSGLVINGQSAASTDTVLHAVDAAKIMPAAVFFQGQSAPIQGRNSAGIRFADNHLLLAALIDTSGYSTAVQQKYQTYLIVETPIEINGQQLIAGAYGAGFQDGHFLVMDIGGSDVFSVAAVHDADLKRPTPLQILADPAVAGHYRLYQGRDYIVLARTPAR